YVAASLYESTSFFNIVFTTVFAALHVIILVVSKDLGSALIFLIAYLFMVFVATKNYLYLLLGIGGGIGSAVVAYHYFKHVQVRVQAWLDPWTYIDNQGYQVTQSLFGVGSGSWFGMGLMSGNPDTIPYVEMDSVFSAICEEMGVIFGIMLILICISCFIMMMNMALLIKDNFYRYVSYGLGVIYIFQVFLTIGGSIKFIPLTGVTLPLVSYGGSSVMSTLIMFYIVQGLYLIRQKEERYGKRKKRRPNREKRYRRETETIPPEDDLVFLNGETE
ncbi:MAG: FtsW/RodA/SpoVE family cell cycle protein, partial [Lachnospiraceae bacterium]|nr:FtsW/RodA/SpoVE family cell cycle protein [Lachnospiraceae bacterium]